MFSGGHKTEGIKTWDIRAQKCVYELSTGNTSVMGLAWSSAQSTLYAATACPYLDWQGGFSGYRDLNTGMLHASDIMAPKTRRHHTYWPDRALHVENAFGYAYDAGMHVMCRFTSRCRTWVMY